MELIRSEEFTIPRVTVARITAEAYVRQFWWFIIPGPLFGIVVLVLAQDPLLQAIGALGCIWPLTIPFRAYLISAKVARRLYSHSVRVVATDDSLLLYGAFSTFAIHYAALRNAYIRHGMIVINTKRFAVVIFPANAFPERVGAFMKVLSDHGVRVKTPEAVKP